MALISRSFVAAIRYSANPLFLPSQCFEGSNVRDFFVLVI